MADAEGEEDGSWRYGIAFVGVGLLFTIGMGVVSVIITRGVTITIMTVSYDWHLASPDKSVCSNPPYFEPSDEGDGLLHGSVHFIRNGSILHGAEVTYRWKNTDLKREKGQHRCSTDLEKYIWTMFLHWFWQHSTSTIHISIKRFVRSEKKTLLSIPPLIFSISWIFILLWSKHEQIRWWHWYVHINIFPIFQLWWGLSIGGACPADLWWVRKFVFHFWKFFACFLPDDYITRNFRESKGWLPEGENTLCFKSNAAPADADADAAAA